VFAHPLALEGRAPINPSTSVFLHSDSDCDECRAHFPVMSEHFFNEEFRPVHASTHAKLPVINHARVINARATANCHIKLPRGTCKHIVMTVVIILILV
jgi:hypothetical protein